MSRKSRRHSPSTSSPVPASWPADTMRARGGSRLPAGAHATPIPQEMQQAYLQAQQTISQPGVPPTLQGANMAGWPYATGTNIAGQNTTDIAAYRPAPPEAGGLMANLPGAKGGLISFAPGDPIRPAPMLDDAFGGPRVFAYSTGVNITAIPRNTEGIGFLQLRNLARLYWGVQACVEVILRILDRLELQVVPHPDFLGVGDDGNADKWLEPARRIRDWFEQPHRTQGLHPWMRAVMRDLLEIDACGVFHERTRGGQLAGLRFIAGDTLIRYMDTVGTVPVRPYPAYGQAVHGAIGWEGTADDLDYLRVEERTDSLYGLPPTEQIIVIVNTALRAQNFDLTQYTRGSTPEGWIETDNPALLNVSADQIKTFEDLLNATLAGNDALRVGLKAMIPGWHYKQTKANEAPLPLHEFLLAATVSMYGLSKEELSFTDTSNRSTGAKQEDVVYRNAVRPRTDFIARYFNGIIRRYDGLAIADRNAMLSLPGRATKPAKGMWDSRFRVRWGGIEEPEDWNQRAFALNALSKSGIIGPTQVKHMLKIPVMPGEQHVPPWTLAPAGPNSIVFLDDLLAQRDQINAAHGAQLDAQTQQAQQQTAIGSEQQQQATLDTQAKKHQLTMAQLQIEATKEHNKQAKEQTTQMGQQTQAQAQQLANPQQGPQSPKSGGPPRPPTGGGQPNGPRPAAPSGAAPAASRPALANRGGPTVSGGRKSGGRGADDAVGSAVATTGNEDDADVAGAPADDREPDDGTDTTSPVGGADNPSGRGAGLHDAARVPADDRDAAGPGQGGPGDAAYRPRAEPDEWRAWRQKALKAAKEGRRQPAWDRTGTALPEDAHQHVSTQLAGIKTPDEVRAIFEAARQRPATPPAAPDDDPHTGIMVAFMLPSDAAQQLAERRDEDLRMGSDIKRQRADDMHVTLAYLGETTDEAWTPQKQQQLRRVVEDFAADRQPFTGRVATLGRFHNGGKDPTGEGDAVHGVVESSGLQDFRKALVATLKARDLPVDETFHDYQPHVTLAYVPPDEPTPPIELPQIDIPFHAVTVAIGDAHSTHPLGTEQNGNALEGTGRADPLADLASALLERLEASTTREVRALRAQVAEALGA